MESREFGETPAPHTRTPSSEGYRCDPKRAIGGWKEKLLENPTLHVTSYGLTFMTWRFKESIEGIHIILRTEPTERHFDLVQWKDHSYNIYNSVIDLHSFERLGGVPRGKGKYQGRGMRFDPAADGVRPFEEFIRFVHENPIPFRPVPRSPDEK